MWSQNFLFLWVVNELFGINELFDSNMSSPIRQSCTRHSIKAFPLSLLVFLRPQRNLESIDPQFTIRRKMEQMREEKELVEQLREVPGNIVLLNNNFQHWSSILYFLKVDFEILQTDVVSNLANSLTDCLLLGKPFHISEFEFFPILKQWFPSTFVGFCGESIR